MNSKHKGFSSFALIIIVLATGIAGVAGFLVYQNNVKKEEASQKAANQKMIEDALENGPDAKQNGVSAQSKTSDAQATYLTFNEWKLRIRLSDPIMDAYYTIGGYDYSGKIASQMALSIKSLEMTQCKANGWPPSIYFRYTATDTDPVSGKLYTNLYGKAHQIGNYYYAYKDATGINDRDGCQSNAIDQSKAEKAAAAFKSALNTLQPIN